MVKKEVSNLNLARKKGKGTKYFKRGLVGVLLTLGLLGGATKGKQLYEFRKTEDAFAGEYIQTVLPSVGIETKYKDKRDTEAIRLVGAEIFAREASTRIGGKKGNPRYDGLFVAADKYAKERGMSKENAYGELTLIVGRNGDYFRIADQIDGEIAKGAMSTKGALRVIGIAGFVGGIIFIAPNITGNIVSEFSKASSSMIGLALLLIGFILTAISFRK